MPTKSSLILTSTEVPPRVSGWRRFGRVFLSRAIVIFGAVIIVVFVITAIFAPFLTPHDPLKTNLSQALLQPSLRHPLGTDANGRDLFSRIIAGSRIALMVGVVSVAIGSVIGMAMGLVAGYFGGSAFIIIMRFTDALMSLPPLLVALIITALLGSGLINIMIAIGISMIPPPCRIMCGQVLSVKEQDFILAERSIGSSDFRILLRHVFPNCLSPLIVQTTMQLGFAILAEASLSFLGIGIALPAPAWGGMVNDGRQFLATHPIISVAPGFAIMLVVFAFNMVGDGLRDALDPRLRGIL